MILTSKSEWFELSSPLGEPEIDWPTQRWNDSYTEKEPNTYYIERRLFPCGKVVWYGQGTNWVKESNKGWTVLTTDETVEPLYDNVYPENRLYWKPCELPIYEKLYLGI